MNTGLNNNSAVLTGSQSDQYISISEWLHKQWDARDIRRRRCRTCNNNLRRRHIWLKAPEMLAFTSMNSQLKIIDEYLVVTVEGVQKTYMLAGAIYHGQGHFTARVIVDREYWFHDGMTTGKELIPDTRNARADMTKCRGQILITAVYTLLS